MNGKKNRCKIYLALEKSKEGALPFFIVEALDEFADERRHFGSWSGGCHETCGNVVVAQGVACKAERNDHNTSSDRIGNGLGFQEPHLMAFPWGAPQSGKSWERRMMTTAAAVAETVLLRHWVQTGQHCADEKVQQLRRPCCCCYCDSSYYYCCSKEADSTSLH